MPELERHLGTHRVLVIDTPDPAAADYRTQAAALLPEWSGLQELDISIVTQVKAASFRVRLVGKDGGVKLDSSTPVVADALFTLIDAMPIRRDEMRSRK